MCYIQTEYKFGSKSILEIDGPYSLATGVIEHDNSSIVITTPGDLFRFESNKYKDRFFYKFVATAYSKNNNILFGATENPSTLMAISLSEIGHPLIKGHLISQNNIKKMFFFEKSKTLLIIGDSVRCYEINFNPFAIYLVKIFTDEILLTKPSIADYENEIIYLFTKDEGYSAFDLDGIRSQKSYFLDSIEYYSNDIGDGIIFDSEHILFLINQTKINVINIKTKKNFCIAELFDKANRLFKTNDNNISLSFDGKITFYEISLFWKTWIPAISNPFSIERCNKLQSAARILIEGEKGTYFISPRDGLEISKVECQNDNVNNYYHSPSYFYDRGYIVVAQFKGSTNNHVYRVNETTRRERFFQISSEGIITVYNTNVWPFKEISWKDVNAKSMTVCKYEESWNYLISTSQNELLIMNPKTLDIGQSFQVTGPPILSVGYYYPTNLVLLIREQELTFYDLKKDLPLCRAAVNKFTVCKTNAEIIYLGFENGSVERISMNNRSLKSKDKVKVHDAPVTDFAFSPSFWLSSAKDGTIYFWDYTFHAVFIKITLPLTVNCLCVINGQKDVVVGIEDSVMILDRKLFYYKNKKDEKEAKSIDSYNALKDRFVPVSNQDPIGPSDFTEYPMSEKIAPSKEFPVTIYTVRPSSQPLSVRAPRRQTNSNTKSLMSKSPRNITKNNNAEEYEYDKYDYIEYDDENNINIMDLNNGNQNDDDAEDNPNDITSKTYNANFPIVFNDDDDAINDDEEFFKLDLQKEYSQPVKLTPMKPHSSPENSLRLITAPIIIDGPAADLEKTDTLFANTQPESGMTSEIDQNFNITKSMRIFADDADSDSDDDEFFKERFPLRSRNSLYIESSRKKVRVPYIPIPTDLYETTKPKLKPHAKIVTPKAEPQKKKSPLVRA